MKTVRMTTTEFYKNPSKAIMIVKEGGVVYLGYKKLKKPIAQILPANDEISMEKTKDDLVAKRLKALQKNQFKSKIWKSGLELQKAIRQ